MASDKRRPGTKPKPKKRGPTARRTAAKGATPAVREASGPVELEDFEAGLAENSVRRFEKRTGEILDWRRFARTIETARHLMLERSAIEHEAKAIRGPAFILGRTLKERQRETQESFAALKALNEKRRERLEEQQNALAAEWKALNFLSEVLDHVPDALECRRVRLALRCLRGSWILFREEDLPPELRKLLERVGRAIANPQKYTGWKPTKKEQARLNLWGMRDSLTPDERERRATALGLGKKREAPTGGVTGWESLKALTFRYIARGAEDPAAEEKRLGELAERVAQARKMREGPRRRRPKRPAR